MNNVTISIFSDEMIVKVFQYLERKDLLNSARVCKQWNSCSEENKLWLSELNSYIPPEILKPNYQLKDNLKLKNVIKQCFLAKKEQQQIKLKIKELREELNNLKGDRSIHKKNESNWVIKFFDSKYLNFGENVVRLSNNRKSKNINSKISKYISDYNNISNSISENIFEPMIKL